MTTSAIPCLPHGRALRHEHDLPGSRARPRVGKAPSPAVPRPAGGCRGSADLYAKAGGCSGRSRTTARRVPCGTRHPQLYALILRECTSTLCGMRGATGVRRFRALATGMAPLHHDDPVRYRGHRPCADGCADRTPRKRLAAAKKIRSAPHNQIVVATSLIDTQVLARAKAVGADRQWYRTAMKGPDAGRAPHDGGAYFPPMHRPA